MICYKAFLICIYVPKLTYFSKFFHFVLKKQKLSILHEHESKTIININKKPPCSTISSYINWRVIQTLVENLANTPFPTAQKLEKTYKEDKEKNEKEKEKDGL